MRICYINFNLKNARDQITLQGLKENGVVVKEISDNTRGFKKYRNIARAYFAVENDSDVVMVGYAGSVLVIFMRLLSALGFLTGRPQKKIIYNALATFYDSMIVSRYGGRLFSVFSAWYYLVDFVAFRAATHSFLECQAQKELVVRIFKINPRKISIQFVGTDDTQFYFDGAVPKLAAFTVVFRGAFLPEAGADVVVRAAKELENDNVVVRILGRGLLLREIQALVAELQPKNLELITELLPIQDLRKKMLECHVSLGQLAKHPRVHTTIPHKVFESMAMKLPYLTGRNVGVMEIIEDGKTCFTAPPGDHMALAQKIRELKNQPQKLAEVAEAGYQLYLREFTPKILARKVVTQIASQ